MREHPALSRPSATAGQTLRAAHAGHRGRACGSPLVVAVVFGHEGYQILSESLPAISPRSLFLAWKAGGRHWASPVVQTIETKVSTHPSRMTQIAPIT
jgi:hypothetical protein